MITLPRYDTADTTNIDTVTDYSEMMSQAAAITGFTQHTLKDSAGGRTIYGFSYGDMSKPCIVIDGCIHNYHEWKSAHGAIELMRVVSNPALYAEAQTAIESLKDKYCFYVIPILSPDSYIDRTRTNANNVALDKNFDFEFKSELDQYDTYSGDFAFSEPETQNLRDVVGSVNTSVYVNLHSVGSKDNTIMLRRARMPLSDSIMVALADDIVDIYPVDGKFPLLNIIRTGSSSYNWVGSQEGYEGVQMEAVVIEAGSSLDLPLTKSLTTWAVMQYLINVNLLRESDELEEIKPNNLFLYSYNHHRR